MMNILEKILEKIYDDTYDVVIHCISKEEQDRVVKLIEDSNWIPVDVKLPEINKIVIVTVHTSEWTSDFDSKWVREEEKIFHPESCDTYLGRRNKSGEWIFWDEEMGETICDKEFGTDKGCCYSKVIAWKPFSEPYKPTEG